MLDTFIEMTPVSKARPRVVNGHAYTPEKTRRAEDKIQYLVRSIYRQPPMEGALTLTLTVYIEKPKTSTRLRPTVKPDADNYAKLVCDALNGIVWRDDAQVCRLFVEKVYCYPEKPKPGFRITVYEMDKDC